MPHIAVFDTNVLLSSLLSIHGNPFRCVAFAKAALVESVTCEEILEEFRDKLRMKFADPLECAVLATDEVSRS